MSSDLCVKRLEREYLALKRSPPALVLAAPLEKDIRQWLFVLDGPADTPYAGGQYLGTITFPATYPYAPPSIRMLTPSGRFVPNERICLSMSDFHPVRNNRAAGNAAAAAAVAAAVAAGGRACASTH